MIIQKTREMYFFLLIFIPMNTNIHASLFSFCEKLQFFKSRDGNYFVKCLIKQHVRRTSASKGRHFIGWTAFFLGLLTSVILWLKWKQHEMSPILFYKLHKKHIKMWKQTLLNILIRCCLFFFHRVVFSFSWPYWKKYDAIVTWPFFWILHTETIKCNGMWRSKHYRMT